MKQFGPIAFMLLLPFGFHGLQVAQGSATAEQTSTPATEAAALAAFRAQLATIRHNEVTPPPHSPVVLQSSGVDAWLAGPGQKKLPAGVSQVRLWSGPGMIHGSALVDFDQVHKAHPNSNPLVEAMLESLFTGVHQVGATARVDSPSAPKAQLTITQVTLDGQAIPSGLIDAAIAAFVTPHHPDIRRTFQVSLPRHVRQVEVRHNQVVLQY